MRRWRRAKWRRRGNGGKEKEADDVSDSEKTNQESKVTKMERTTKKQDAEDMKKMKTTT
jgi:hypothetical protein